MIKVIRILLLGCLFIVADTTGEAQLLGYEPFSGMQLGSGLTGSGTNSSDWTNGAWSGGNDAHFQTIDAAPDLAYQNSDGAALNGGDRAVLLTTSPEPISGTLYAFRNITPQNTTVYVSFLMRATQSGTGSDALGLRLRFSDGTVADLLFKPDSTGTRMFPLVSVPNFSGTQIA